MKDSDILAEEKKKAPSFVPAVSTAAATTASATAFLSASARPLTAHFTPVLPSFFWNEMDKKLNDYVFSVKLETLVEKNKENEVK